jgi:hypothetical protein
VSPRARFIFDGDDFFRNLTDAAATISGLEAISARARFLTLSSARATADECRFTMSWIDGVFGISTDAVALGGVSAPFSSGMSSGPGGKMGSGRGRSR